MWIKYRILHNKYNDKYIIQRKCLFFWRVCGFHTVREMLGDVIFHRYEEKTKEKAIVRLNKIVQKDHDEKYSKDRYYEPIYFHEHRIQDQPN